MIRVFLAAITLLTLSPAFGADKLSGGNGTLYLGGRPNRIFVIDEAAEKVVDEMHCKTGLPIALQLSSNRKLFYVQTVSYEDIDIIDIASRKVLDSFRLSDGNKKVRIFSFVTDPQDRYMVLLTKTATKLADRFEAGSPMLLQYDLKDHKVLRIIPWPGGEEREFLGMRFSPDGKLLYLFGEDVLVLDTNDFKQIDKWELSRPLENGLGHVGFHALNDPFADALDDLNEEPGFLTNLFTVQDAVNNRSIMGVARVDLAHKSADFYPLGPDAPVSFALAPGRKWGYGVHSEIGKYEFWSFDLANRRLGPRVEIQGRPRMSLKTSTNGKLLYIFEAGNTIDLYDAATFKYLRTITLDADMTTTLYVMHGK